MPKEHHFAKPRVAYQKVNNDVSDSAWSALRSAPPGNSTVPTRCLLFDCDGVITDTESLHLIAYNAAWSSNGLQFEEDVAHPPVQVVWSEQYYDMLQNKVGGGREQDEVSGDTSAVTATRAVRTVNIKVR